MTSSDLFSHPYEPEFMSYAERHSESVQPPSFSDSPHSDSAATTPADDVGRAKKR